MGYQVVRFTKETTYNTYASGGATNDFFLPTDDAITVLPDPQFYTIRDAGVGNRLVVQNVGRVNVGGDLQTYLFPSQMAYLKSLIDIGGSAPCYDLPSFTVDRGVYLEGGSCTRADRRFTGCKFGQIVLSADQSAQGSLFMLKASILGSTPAIITDTDLPLQTLTNYPADDPYLFYQTATKLIIGSARQNYQSVSLTIDNMIKGFPDESKYLGHVQWFGRTVTLSAKLLYKSYADRLTYEAGTPITASLGMDNTVTSTLFALGTNAKITGLTETLQMGDFFTQSITITALMDRTLTPPTDLTITVTTD